MPSCFLSAIGGAGRVSGELSRLGDSRRAHLRRLRDRGVLTISPAGVLAVPDREFVVRGFKSPDRPRKTDGRFNARRVVGRIGRMGERERERPTVRILGIDSYGR